MSRSSYFCFGRCDRHAMLLNSGFHMLAKSVFVFLQSTMPHSSGLDKHKCSQCHRSCAHLSSLRVHEATHTGRYRYWCQVCGYASLYILRTHEAIHSGRYPYWCKVCGKGFQVTSHLHRHMAQHTGVAEFKCDICGRQYRYQCGYKRHMKQHSKESLTY